MTADSSIIFNLLPEIIRKRLLDRMTKGWHMTGHCRNTVGQSRGTGRNRLSMRRPAGRAAGLACLVVVLMVAAGCGSRINSTAASYSGAGPTTPSTAGTTVAPTATPVVPIPQVSVTEQDFHITPATASTTAGLVDLAVTDHGPTAHELLIFQSNLTPDNFPMKDGRVDETGDGITKVFDSGANIDVNTTKSFHAALTAGNYYLVCNLPGHFLAGMHTAFTVKPTVPTPVAIATTEKDFSITPAAISAKGGLVDFTVANTGPSPHEFLIFQSDLGPDKFPLGSDGRVNEAAEGITKVFDSGTNIDVGGTKTFHAALTPGHYVLVCNLPGGHYAAGMHTAFTVN
jgi:uncharacterized cupredoxin-like copper-binding protein